MARICQDTIDRIIKAAEERLGTTIPESDIYTMRTLAGGRFEDPCSGNRWRGQDFVTSRPAGEWWLASYFSLSKGRHVRIPAVTGGGNLSSMSFDQCEPHTYLLPGVTTPEGWETSGDHMVECVFEPALHSGGVLPDAIRNVRVCQSRTQTLVSPWLGLAVPLSDRLPRTRIPRCRKKHDDIRRFIPVTHPMLQLTYEMPPLPVPSTVADFDSLIVLVQCITRESGRSERLDCCPCFRVPLTNSQVEASKPASAGNEPQASRQQQSVAGVSVGDAQERLGLMALPLRVLSLLQGVERGDLSTLGKAGGYVELTYEQLALAMRIGCVRRYM